MNARSLHRDLAAVAAALDEAGAQADAGAPVDLCGLDGRVAALCGAVDGLSRDEARALLPDLEALVAALGALASTLARQRDLAAGGETHTARQRAAAVYRRPAPPPTQPDAPVEEG